MRRSTSRTARYHPRPVVEPLEERVLLTGVTLITHGLGSSASTWVRAMGDAIAARASATSDPAIYTLTVTDPNHSGGALRVSAGSRTGTNPHAATRSPEIILLLDWSDVAGSVIGGYSRPSPDVAEAVAAALANPAFFPDLGIPLADLPFHLIGHSRGASVVSQLALDLGRRGIWVDQVTTLDPVPIPLYGDPIAAPYRNITFFDNDFQQEDLIAIGFAVPGAHNTGPLHLPGAYSGFPGGNHNNVHLYYHGTIDTSAGANDYSQVVPADWYGSAQTRASTGYAWSRIAGGVRPSDGVGSNFGGSALRVAVSADLPQWSNIADIVPAATSISPGGSVQVNFRYEDRDSSEGIQWFLDPDQNPFNGNEVPVGSQVLGSVNTPTAGSITLTLPGQVQQGAYRLGAWVNDGAHARVDYARAAVSVDRGLMAYVDVFNSGWIAGWAYDREAGSGPVTVRVDIDGVTRATVPASWPRADLQSFLGSSRHGFYYVLPKLASGYHTINVYVLDTPSDAAVGIASRVVGSFTSLFDERFYLQTYPDVANGVAAGAFSSGGEHYLRYGQFEGRRASPLFDDAYYLSIYPAVATAIQNHQITSAFMHYVNVGQRQGLQPNIVWNDAQYLQRYPDVATGVRAGVFASGFDHYNLYGEAEGRSPAGFNEQAYRQRYPDVAEGIAQLVFRSGYEHYVRFGRAEGRNPL